MLEKLLTGQKRYYAWLLFLLVVIAVCGIAYLQQLQEGLSITGMSRDVFVMWLRRHRALTVVWRLRAMWPSVSPLRTLW